MFWSYNLHAEKVQIWVTEAADKICFEFKLFWLKKNLCLLKIIKFFFLNKMFLGFFLFPNWYFIYKCN